MGISQRTPPNAICVDEISRILFQWHEMHVQASEKPQLTVIGSRQARGRL